MSRKKHKKLAEVQTLPNVFNSHQSDLVNRINRFFGNDLPFTLELGCGDGDFTLSLAAAHPGKNFIGVDFKGSRVWNGASIGLERKLPNAAFINSKVEELKDLLSSACTEEIIIPFPDPHKKRRSTHRRLVAPEFVELYKYLLIPGGKVHLKTDNPHLFEFAKSVLDEMKIIPIHFSYNLYKDEISTIATEVKTRYEKNYLDEGRKINYLCFGFDS